MGKSLFAEEGYIDDDSFDVAGFLKRISQDSDIWTGKSIESFNDSAVPSNVENPEDYKRAEIQRRLQTDVPSNLEETNRNMAQPQRDPAVLAKTGAPTNIQFSNKLQYEAPTGALPPAAQPPAQPPAQVPAQVPAQPSGVLTQGQGQPAQTGALPPDEMAQIEQAKNEKVAQLEKKAYEVAEKIPDDPNVKDTGDYFANKLESLGKMFQKRMNKVEQAQYNRLSDSQRRDVRLRFFLALMEEGGKKGSSSFLGNVGKAGRVALDAKRVITNQNNQLEEKRYARDSKRAYDEMNFELKGMQNQVNRERWKASMERWKRGDWKLGVNSKGNMVSVYKDGTNAKEIKDEDGNPVKGKVSASAAAKEPAMIQEMRAIMTEEEFKDPAKRRAFYDKYKGKSGGKGKEMGLTEKQKADILKDERKQILKIIEDSDPGEFGAGRRKTYAEAEKEFYAMKQRQEERAKGGLRTPPKGSARSIPAKDRPLAEKIRANFHKTIALIQSRTDLSDDARRRLVVKAEQEATRMIDNLRR